MPVIFSIFLFSWSKISMSFIVHFCYLRMLLHCPSNWIKYIFSTFTTYCCNSKWITVRIVNSLWPVIVSLIWMTQRLFQLACIFIFLYVIKLVSKTCQILSFNHSINMIRSICLLSICKVIWYSRSIIKESWMNLLYTRLILSAFTISTDVFRSSWDINQVIVVLYGCLCWIITHCNHLTCSSDIGNGIWS